MEGQRKSLSENANNSSEKSKSSLSKLKSVKLWITVWATAMISFIVIAGKTDFYGIAQLLCSIPLSYVVANVAQKAIYAKTDVNINQHQLNTHE